MQNLGIKDGIIWGFYQKYHNLSRFRTKVKFSIQITERTKVKASRKKNISLTFERRVKSPDESYVVESDENSSNLSNLNKNKAKKSRVSICTKHLKFLAHLEVSSQNR